ncbi:MAG TPA: metalloregulator ArsR/SmtB family transcription factor [Acidimicrobiales bacterium]|nr:metalloregulator ArsR/SmtB family transcription factor [Acidimicrobiales bacterium]
MVECELGLDETFAALSHPVRREMLNALRDAPMRVTDLAEPFTISLAASSKHIRVLEHAGLVARRISGRDHLLALETIPLAGAGHWINTYSQFWEDRLDALAAQLRRRSRG